MSLSIKLPSFSQPRYVPKMDIPDYNFLLAMCTCVEESILFHESD